jgi:8-oxo-dGTP pyrophosphatase MutT (NUDIX family)
VFDVTRPPSVPTPAATVIVVRERPRAGIEVFLVKRHRKSQFMSDAFVFPGGKIDASDGSPQVAAIRELFEEAGILLARGEAKPGFVDNLPEWRRRLNGREVLFSEVLVAGALRPDVTRLHWWAQWITPSVEPRRFDTHFFLAAVPPDADPTIDEKETVEAVWLTPEEALERHRAESFRLPPPQVKTLTEMLPYAGAGMRPLAEAAARRKEHAHPIMPRFAELDGKVALLLPWDPVYQTAGVGEALPMPHGHFFGGGPSRFVLEGMTWRLEYAPGSLRAG